MASEQEQHLRTPSSSSLLRSTVETAAHLPTSGPDLLPQRDREATSTRVATTTTVQRCSPRARTTTPSCLPDLVRPLQLVRLLPRSSFSQRSELRTGSCPMSAAAPLCHPRLGQAAATTAVDRLLRITTSSRATATIMRRASARELEMPHRCNNSSSSYHTPLPSRRCHLPSGVLAPEEHNQCLPRVRAPGRTHNPSVVHTTMGLHTHLPARDLFPNFDGS